MILDKFKLTGKTALVTGASHGIGKAIAIGLAEAGANIIALNRTAVQPEDELACKIKSCGRTFAGYCCDLADRKALYAAIAKIQKEQPPVDILVNNAGMAFRTPAAEFPDEMWDKTIELNLTSGFILAREFGKGMLARGNGKILFTASLMSFQGGILIPAYASSKGAIASLIKELSNEWSGKGVCVNAIAPGYIKTRINDALIADPVRGPAISSRIPAGRWGEAEDLAGAAVYLCSPAADYVTGHLLTVDGGWMGR